jgi:hypothetical protein
MPNRLRRILAVTCAALLLSTALTTSLQAKTVSESDAANAPVAVDALVLRPAGLVGLVIGTALFVVATPFVLITRPHEIGKPFDALVVKPAKFLWIRSAATSRPPGFDPLSPSPSRPPRRRACAPSGVVVRSDAGRARAHREP